MKPTQSMGIVVLLITTALSIFGCAGTAPLNTAYRAGDTVALGAGWKQHFDRNSLTVTITGADNSITTYPPGDARVRAIVNLYPDPLSWLVVGTRTGSNTNYGSTYGSTINSLYTGWDPDWWQTTLFLDLPTTLPVGTANVSISSTSGESYGPIPVSIVAGQGSPSSFSAQNLGPMSPTQLQSMEREPSFAVKFSGGSTVPAALQVDLTHDPSSAAGGTGTPSVVNPRGEMKNITWTDNGTSMRVMVLTAGDGSTKDPYTGSYMWKYFKFYVSGGITGLAVVPNSIKAYDGTGASITGVTATVQ